MNIQRDVSRNAVPWSKHVGIRIWVPMAYLKFWNYIFIVRAIVNGRPQEAVGDHRGQARAQILAQSRNLVLYQRRQDPKSYACLGEMHHATLLMSFAGKHPINVTCDRG